MVFMYYFCVLQISQSEEPNETAVEQQSTQESTAESKFTFIKLIH